MGDLFNLVTRSKDYNQTKFWGDYAFLNHAGAGLTNDICLKYQLSKLKGVEQQSSTVAQLNSFLKSLEALKTVQIQDKIVEMTENDIYRRILEILNMGLYGNTLNPRRQKQQNNNLNIQSYIQEVIIELKSLLTAIEFSGDPYVADIVERQLQGNKFVPFSDSFATSYVQYKADLAEKLMVNAFQRKLSNGAQTGQLYSGGKQIIQDALSLPMELVFDSPFSVSFSQKKSSIKENALFNNFKDLFSFIEKASGNYSIEITDELTELIERYKLLAGQAKSGYSKQSLLNQTKRNSISLSETEPTASLIALDQLYRLKWIDSSHTSKDLSMIANYCLSKSIGKTNIIKNDIYFTKDGFTTAATWMENNSMMLKFLPPVNSISNNFLGVPRTYNLSSTLT